MMQSEPTYSVFARKRKPALRCAIAEESPLPSFINDEAWEFASVIKPSEPMPLGFQPKATQEAVQIIGWDCPIFVDGSGGLAEQGLR
jgi:hypothetical protein